MGMVRNIALGRYIYQESFIHRLDPRVKLLSLCAIFAGLVLLKSMVSLLMLGLLLVYVLMFSHVPVRAWLKGFRLFIWFFTVLMILYGWHGYRGADLLLPICLRIRYGILAGVIAATRWLLLIGFCFLLTMTTSPSDLTWTFQALLGPFRKVGFPVDDISIMAGLSLHFLPLLKEEAERLIMVTKARGIRFDSGGFFERVRHIIGLVPPLLIRIFRRSERIAMAMEARGYADTGRDGSGIDGITTPLGHTDVYAFGCLILYLAGAWCIERFFLV